jgi:hypothetical protein
MKKYLARLSLLLVLSLAAAATAAAQVNPFGPTIRSMRAQRDTVPYHFNVQLMPLSFLGQGLELAGELKIARKTTVRLTGGYYLGTNPWFYSPAEKYNGARGELQVRFFAGDIAQAREGFYMAPFLQVKTISLEKVVTSTTNNWITAVKKYNVTAPSFGVVIGWERVAPSGFVLDLFIGGGLIIPNNNEDAKEVQIDVINPYTQGIMLRSGLGIGLAR